MTQKLSKNQFQDICEKIKNEKYIRVTSSYEDFRGVDSPLDASCLKCGNSLSYSITKFRCNIGCKFCNKKAKMSMEEFLKIKQEMEENGLIVLLEYSEYKGLKVKENVFCEKCRTYFKRSFNDMRTGEKKCLNCFSNSKKNEAWVVSALETAKRKGFVYIGSDDVFSVAINKNLLFMCSVCGFNIEKTLKSASMGLGCPICQSVVRLREEQYCVAVKMIEEKNKIKVKTKYESYINSSKPLNCECLVCGKEIHPNLNNLLKGSGCFFCKNKNVVSNQENEIYEFLREYISQDKIIRNSRELIGKREIDLYIEDCKLGIEYNGLYWHAEDAKGRLYHREKYEESKKVGINLFQVFSDEWANKREIVKSMILNKLGKTQNKIFARTLNLVEMNGLNRDLFQKFFEENHISGWTRAMKCIGLEKDGEIYYAVSFRRPFTKKYSGFIEIARSCSKINYNVVGAFSRIIKHTDYEKILTYSDLRFGDGNVYLKSGFKKVGTTPPDYYYTDFRRRFNRFQFRAQDGKTEEENAHLSNVVRIYGVGSNVFVLDRTN